jgi:hypothetical protein
MDLSNTDWAKKLLKRPLVEIRRGLSLGFNSPREDSSVLALTAPSGKYVDIRFKLSSYDQSNCNAFQENFSGFAAAGLSTARILPGTENCPPYECAINVVWEPSLNFDQDFSLGNADMYLLSNGDVMEVGTVERNGKTHMFKEYWIGPKPEAKQLPCVVIETKGGNDDEALIGMVIRIGDFCQGIIQDKGKEMLLERWEFIGQEGKWARDTRSKTSVSEEETMLPCKWAIGEVRSLGDSIFIDGRRWEVTEFLE